MRIFVNQLGEIYFKNFKAKVSLGKNGIGQKKKEGDLITPIGDYPLREVFYRTDRVKLPTLKIPSQSINIKHAWCNDSSFPEYNTLVNLPFKGTHEKMWRNDHLYNIVIVIGYNDQPVFPEKGSAIFIHLAHNNFNPTEGCIGIRESTMKKILNHIEPNSRIIIH